MNHSGPFQKLSVRHHAHEQSLNRDVDYYAARIEVDEAAAMRDPSNLGRLAGSALAHAGMLALADPNAPALQSSWGRSAYASAGVFVAAAAEDRLPVNVRLSPGREVVVSHAISSHIVDANSWVHAFAMALTVRDEALLDTLCSLDPAVLRRSPTECDEFVFTLVDALRALHRRSTDTSALLLEALRQTASENLVVAPDWALDIAVPFIDMIFRLLDRDQTGFDAALMKALERHRAYYLRFPDWVTDPRGFIARLPLAAACLAVDSGFEVRVKTEYLPEVILIPPPTPH